MGLAIITHPIQLIVLGLLFCCTGARGRLRRRRAGGDARCSGSALAYALSLLVACAVADPVLELARRDQPDGRLVGHHLRDGQGPARPARDSRARSATCSRSACSALVVMLRTRRFLLLFVALTALLHPGDQQQHVHRRVPPADALARVRQGAVRAAVDDGQAVLVRARGATSRCAAVAHARKLALRGEPASAARGRVARARGAARRRGRPARAAGAGADGAGVLDAARAQVAGHRVRPPAARRPRAARAVAAHDAAATTASTASACSPATTTT